MQILIDIPESQYKTLNAKTQEDVVDVIDDKLLIDAIKNGVPLPKGHGDLKDVDNLKHAFVMWSMAVQGNFSDADIASIICNSPTIIEADKSESEDKE